MKKIVLVFAALLLAAHGAIADQREKADRPPKYFVDETKLPFAEVPGIPTQREWGVQDHAGYRIEVPDNWNGSLVMWAHGFRGTGLELTVDNHPLRAFLIANGYAWAASSYSKNDYEPVQGAKDTHALTKLFRHKFGHPTRTYITGASMGGHVTGIVTETWPQTYDGAMPICGVLGDYELFDYFLDFNLAAQTLSGEGKLFPYASDYLTVTVPATKAALGLAPTAPFPFALNAAGQDFKSLVQLRSGGVRPVFEQGFLFWNGVVPGDFLFGLGVGDGTLPRHRGVVVQNSDVVYQFDTDRHLTAAEHAFNDAIQRISADRKSRDFDDFSTTGDLRIPMLTLHTLGDLFVPFLMEQVYAKRVARHHASRLLVQRATRDFGHCSFTGPELVTTFVDLVNWVEGGVKPAGDNVRDPVAVADPNFGCTFTDKVSPRFWNQPGLGFLAPPACPAP